jgi:hypothetical protein
MYYRNPPVLLGPPQVQCLSLQCEHNGGCQPVGMTNSLPPHYIYPPDCARGVVDPLPPAGHPYGDDMVTPGGPVTGQEPSASTPAPLNLADLFGNMSTTMLLLLGGAAWFLFFRKGR